MQFYLKKINAVGCHSLLHITNKFASPIVQIGATAMLQDADDYFGAILQYPGKFGQIFDYENFVAKAIENKIKVELESIFKRLKKIEVEKKIIPIKEIINLIKND